MNIDQEWNNLNLEFSTQASKMEVPPATIDEESHSLLQDLLFKLRWKLKWIRIISILLLIGAFIAHSELRILLLLVFLVYEGFRYLGLRKFNRIKTGVDYNSNTRNVLTMNVNAIEDILRGERTFGYVFLPLAGPLGFLAFQLYKYEHIEKVIQFPHFWLKLVIVSLLGLPFIYLTRIMNNSIFEKPVHNLKEKINQLMN